MKQVLHTAACIYTGRHRRLMVAVLICLWAGFAAHGKELLLKSVVAQPDKDREKTTKVVLTFGAAPTSFPIYAMTDPQRIIVDMPDTKISESVKPFESKAPFVKNIDVSVKIIDNISNTRLEVYLKEDAHYTAFISGTQIIIILQEAKKVKETVPVFTAAATSAEGSSISGIEVRSLDKAIEVDVAFTILPQAASIYMLESPARIVMYFNNVFVEKAFEKKVNVAPVKNVSVIKRQEAGRYAGVVVHLDKKVPFSYEQIDRNIVVNIPMAGKRLSKRGKIMIIGTGAILAGGFVTGILLSGQEDAGEGAAQQQDLGAPPAFPDDY